jgi:cytochrome oxidase Cu insertion factor (SCO1/SenC/PrrC family)
MKRILLALVLVSVVALAGVASARQASPDRTSTLKVGDMAPDFTLVDQNRNKVTLSDFRGKQNVVLAFYVLAFTGG